MQIELGQAVRLWGYQLTFCVALLGIVQGHLSRNLRSGVSGSYCVLLLLLLTTLLGRVASVRLASFARHNLVLNICQRLGQEIM